MVFEEHWLFYFFGIIIAKICLLEYLSHIYSVIISRACPMLSQIFLSFITHPSFDNIDHIFTKEHVIRYKRELL
jgi:hypothetical protein